MTRPGEPLQHAFGVPLPWVNLAGGPSLAELDWRRWHPHAACAADDERGSWVDEHLRVTSHEVQVCWRCPVQRQCLASALVYGDEFGVYGGTTTQRRRPFHALLRVGATVGDCLTALLDLGRAKAS